MTSELTQDWLDWIFENIQRGCDRKELLDILLKEGFDPTQCKIALGYELQNDDLYKHQNNQNKRHQYLQNPSISAEIISNVEAEIYFAENFLNAKECDLISEKIKSKQ